jgi:hypothetical protein
MGVPARQHVANTPLGARARIAAAAGTKKSEKAGYASSLSSAIGNLTKTFRQDTKIAVSVMLFAGPSTAPGGTASRLAMLFR